MDVCVDLAADPPRVVLEQPEDCQRFQVSVSGGADPSALAGALAESGFGHLGDSGSGGGGSGGSGSGGAGGSGSGSSGSSSEAWILVSAVRLAAAGRVAPDWPATFEAMLAYASSKGWLSPGGDEIRAHVRWPA